jgi:type II secretory pathway component PulC
LILLFLSCMAKINNMEQDILELQKQNAVLEAKIEEMEEDIEELEEPVQTLYSLMEIAVLGSTQGYSREEAEKRRQQRADSLENKRKSRLQNLEEQLEEFPAPKTQEELQAQILEILETAPRQEMDVSREAVEKLQDIEELTSTIRDVPHLNSQQLIDGYRLSGIRRSSIFDNLGIKNGDILTAVNGIPLTSPAKIMEIYENVKGTTEVTALIQRRNAYLVIEYTLEQDDGEKQQKTVED